MKHQQQPASAAESVLLSKEDLAARFGVKPRTIQEWRSNKLLPPAVKIGATVRYRLSDVLEWERNNLETSQNSEMVV